MTNRARLGGFAATILLLAASVAACGDNGGSPPNTPARAPTSQDDRRGPDLTVPPALEGGSTPPGTLVPTASGLAPGWNLVAPAPDRYTNDNDALMHDFGQDVGMAFGAGGVPVVAWANLIESSTNGYAISASALEPAGPGADPATGWIAPVEVVRARLAPSPNTHLFTIAGDPEAGVIALAIERRDDNGGATGIEVLFSTDEGRTWTRSTAVEGEAYVPSIAVAGPTVAIAFANADGYAVATTTLPARPRSDPPAQIDPRGLTWKTQPVPGIEGFTADDTQPATAVSPSGVIGVATLLASPSAPKRAVAYTTITTGEALTSTKAFEVDKVVPGSGSVAMAFDGKGPMVAASFEPRPDPKVLAVIAASSDGGDTFGPPVPAPKELNERAPYAVSMVITDASASRRTSGTLATTETTAPASVSRTALVYEPDSIDLQASRCGLPRMVSSTDLVTWQTCGVGTDTVTPATAVRPGNMLPTAVAAPSGGVTIGVANRNRSARVPPGIVVWRGD